MEVVHIEGRRDGYAESQCGYTMTVKDIIEYLQENFEEKTPVYLCNDKGYTYGSITEDSFSLEEVEAETK